MGTKKTCVLFVSVLLCFSACKETKSPLIEEDPVEEPCLSRPCARDDLFSITRNSSSNEFSVLLNDLNFDGQTGGANLEITSLPVEPSFGIAMISGGATKVTYTPNTDFAGTDTFSYTIVDTAYTGDGPSTAEVTVVVLP